MNSFIRKPRNKERRPTKEEILKLYKTGKSQREIGEQLGWAQSGISTLMKRYSILTKKSKKWSKEEENIMKKFYLKISMENIQKLLPNRNLGAIKLKAMKLRVSKTKEENNHSSAVRDRLRKLSDNNTIQVKFKNKKDIAYIVGVLDGDGYTDKKYGVGLETKNINFAEKFKKKLRNIGLNPNINKRKERGHWIVWGSSKQLVRWYLTFFNKKKINWLLDNNLGWEYINGLYDSDGALHPCGCPQICGYGLEENKTVSKLLFGLKIENTVHKDKVWIRAKSTTEFFRNVHSIIDYRNPQKIKNIGLEK
ncbi:helix-turn-helix domain-containing protein [Candidatus Pacearchaeota archaeon]|nr:helix-turn-helix domain-containing protein [Candidatus Pacearchaeota archaeon]